MAYRETIVEFIHTAFYNLVSLHLNNTIYNTARLCPCFPLVSFAVYSVYVHGWYEHCVIKQVKSVNRLLICLHP